MLYILAFFSFLLAGNAAPSDSVLVRHDERMATLTPAQREDVLWLARCVYSESNLPHEQRLVAWVVRNRVETSYRGESYRSVVLEPFQFSAFNEGSGRRRALLGLNLDTPTRAWKQALGIATEVYLAPSADRPFSVTTRHFFSPVSMRGRKTPRWAMGETALATETFGISPRRFRFFDNIDEAGGTSRVGRVATADSEPYPESEPEEVEEEEEARDPLGRFKKARMRRARFSGRVARPVRPQVGRPARKSPAWE